jgi:hypothetical protein
MRPRAGTEIPLSLAHARISFGSRVALASGGDGSIAHHPPTPDGSRSNTCRAPSRVRPRSSSTDQAHASRRSIRSAQSRCPRIHQGHRSTPLRLLSPFAVPFDTSATLSERSTVTVATWSTARCDSTTVPHGWLSLAAWAAPSTDAEHRDAPRVTGGDSPTHPRAGPKDADPPATYDNGVVVSSPTEELGVR